MTKNVQKFRPSRIAGLWYSGSADALRKDVDRYIEIAGPVNLMGEAIAIITPHAGHRYSGKTAGYAFRAVKNKEPGLVAILAPYHAYTGKPLMTSAHDAYQTPLGAVWIDREATSLLNQYLYEECGQELFPLVEDEEHALEIELPFLQRALKGDFKILPVMVHTHSPNILKCLGNSLARVLEEKRSPLMVASTDLSHFYPLESARQFDSEILRQMEDFSPEGVLEAEIQGTGFACGAGAVAAVLWAARSMGADKVKILDYSTSADQTGDPASVVGYGSAVVIKSG